MNLIDLLLGAIVILQPTGPIVCWAANRDKAEDRLKDCGTVLKEIIDIPDNIPQDLLDKANCVVIYPSVLKTAFVIGGSYGRGAMTCRKGEDFTGSWGAPTMMALEGGSFGFQLGGQATDFVLLVMNEGGARGILAGKAKLGGDASVAAGPVGRNASAETDVTLRSEILSYSRSRGLFAGVSANHGETVGDGTSRPIAGHPEERGYARERPIQISGRDELAKCALYLPNPSPIPRIRRSSVAPPACGP